MKKIFIYTLAIVTLFSCNNNANKSTIKAGINQNEVIVLGTIHSGHLKYEEYSTEVLKKLIQKINPDVILAEIPPDRFPVAMKEFIDNDTITEPRVAMFPEYVDVIFPLLKKMKFEIIPTAAWTKKMSDERSSKLKEIREDSSRVGDWNQLLIAGKKSDSLIKATGREFDPYWINSDAYDRLSEIELSVYNKLFNEELGLGGWDNINKAHYGYISDALDKIKFQGKRVLITYGAGHKGWFLKELRKRNDIELITLQEIMYPAMD